VGDDEDRLVPATLGAVWLAKLAGREVDKAMVRRNAALIRKWASRGFITQHGTKGRAKLYSLRELEKHAERPRCLT
jgi:hypothetical protein